MADFERMASEAFEPEIADDAGSRLLLSGREPLPAIRSPVAPRRGASEWSRAMAMQQASCVSVGGRELSVADEMALVTRLQAAPKQRLRRESDALVQAATAEHEARARLAKVKARVQRELRRAAAESALEDQREKKRQAGAEVRRDLDLRLERGVLNELADVAPASAEEMRTLSEAFNQKLAIFHPDLRNFYHLFKHIDTDGNQRISFKEFERTCRKGLHLGRAAVADSALHALWRSLDEDVDGFISIGEFGRFMRLAKPTIRAEDRGAVREQIRAKVLADQAAAAAATRAELDERLGRAFSRKMSQVPVASLSEVRHLSEIFNKRLVTFAPESRSFYMLFQHMDTDKNGTISFKELSHMVRTDLQISTKTLSEAKMHSLWRRLDEDGSGTIQAGEFGRFMKLGIDAQQAVEREGSKRAHEALARGQDGRRKKNEIWTSRAAQRAATIAKELEAEASRLELSLSQIRGGSSAALPKLPEIRASEHNKPSPKMTSSQSAPVVGRGVARRRERDKLQKLERRARITCEAETIRDEAHRVRRVYAEVNYTT